VKEARSMETFYFFFNADLLSGFPYTQRFPFLTSVPGPLGHVPFSQDRRFFLVYRWFCLLFLFFFSSFPN